MFRKPRPKHPLRWLMIFANDKLKVCSAVNVIKISRVQWDLKEEIILL